MGADLRFGGTRVDRKLPGGTTSEHERKLSQRGRLWAVMMIGKETDRQEKNVRATIAERKFDLKKRTT